MPKHSVLSEEALELVARRFAVLAEPMRLRLIQALFEGERNVTELVDATGGTQANVSRHLQNSRGSGYFKFHLGKEFCRSHRAPATPNL